MRGDSKVGRLVAGVRQMFFPEEYRIEGPVWSPEVLSAFEQLLHRARPTGEPEPSVAGGPVAGPAPDQQELLKFVVELLSNVGTGLWRMRQNMVRPGTDEPLEEMRRAFRHLQSTWDVLEEAGVQILDHTGQSVPEGGVYSLRAIAYQPTAGLTREKVIETIKPTIYFREQMIQMGEVIIGTPAV